MFTLFSRQSVFKEIPFKCRIKTTYINKKDIRIIPRQIYEFMRNFNTLPIKFASHQIH